MPYLAFNLNDGNEFVFDILEERLSIGRDVKNDIVIDNTYISGFHAEFIRQADGGYELVDLKSSNGTFVNGKRIDRARVKGGDKIRFGQLDSRFRERAPKGTAPSAEAKPASPSKGQPARADGRRGDTESVPARDAVPKVQTSPVEPTKVPLARPDAGGKGPFVAPPPNLPIPKPAALDPALQKQAEELREEVAKLKQERELLRVENEKEARRRDEVRALEKQIEERKQEAVAAEARIATLKAAMTVSEEALSKLDSKRRDVANLDSQLESTRSELEKVQADIAVATKSLQSVHAEADKLSAERSKHLKDKETATEELGALREQIREMEKKAKEASQTFEESKKVESEKVTGLGTELQKLEEQLGARRGELAQVELTLTNLRQEETRRTEVLQSLKDKEAGLSQMTQTLTETEAKLRGKAEELKTLETRSADLTNKLDDLAARDSQLSNANEALKSVESHKAELTAVIAEMTQERDTLTRELLAATEKGKAQHSLTQTLSLRRETLEKAVQEIETQKASLDADLAKVREVLRTAELSLIERQKESTAAETKARTLTEQAETTLAKHDALQKELGTLQEQITQAKAELEKVTAEAKTHQKSAEEARTAHESSRTQMQGLQSQIGGLETLLASLTSSREEHQQQVGSLESEHRKLTEQITRHHYDITEAEKRQGELRIQIAAQESRLGELGDTEKKVAEGKAAVIAAQDQLEKIRSEVQPLQTQREEYEKLLPGLKADVEIVRTELNTLLRDKQSTVTALEKVQSDRKYAADQVDSLRTELTNLEKLLGDKRNSLEAETKAKLAEANVADARLRELQAKIEAGEKRTAELAAIEKQLGGVVQSAKDAEKQRLAEERALADLMKQQDSLRRDIVKLTDDGQTAVVYLADQTKKAKAEEARLMDLASRAQKAQTALQAAEAKRLEAETSANKIREEEKNLRRQVPLLHTELAGLQAMLVSLTKEREEASQFVTRLNVTTENSNKKLSDLQQQISQLEEAHKLREERLMKAQEEVDKEAARLKTAQDATKAAEQALHDLEREVKESRQKADVARTQASGLETELGTRLDRVEKLKMEETRLVREIESQTQELQANGSVYAELQDKIRHEESRLSEFTHVGGQVLAVGAALAALEARQNEAGKSLRDASERELALQVKISSLQETLNRESSRVEQVKKERASLEMELAGFAAEAEKKTATLISQESELRKRLSDLDTQLHDQTATAERLKSELVALNDRRSEFAQAEAQLQHWKEIEARLRGQLLELEEKHEILRRGLTTEESTVVMFANDLIKRIDLIDALSSRYAGYNGGDVVAQLRTLRHSFEDILLQHGVSEFDVGGGTEVDVDMRKRITVVESVPGKNKPRVVETCRSGFIYSREDGHELILRKVEVRTSSQ